MSERPEVKRTSRREIADGLRALGIGEGTVLFMQSDLGALAPLDGRPSDVVLGGIKDAIGDAGTLVVPAFVKQYKRWERDLPASGPTTTPYTGALPRLVMATPGALRSAHPTHSVLALGPHAEAVVAGHDASAACFHPLREVMNNDGVLILMGCVDRTPGMASVHLAQHDLGLSQRHRLRHLLIVGSEQPDGSVRKFHLAESPGCSRGFDRMYPAYTEAGALREGTVGPAAAVAVNARAAYDLDIEALRQDPRFVLCGDPDCIDCRATRGYNKRDIVPAITRRTFAFTADRLRRFRRSDT